MATEQIGVNHRPTDALLLSFHRRKGVASGGEFVSRNFTRMVQAAIDGVLVDVFHDDPCAKRCVGKLSVSISRRPLLGMLLRLLIFARLGRLRFSFSSIQHGGSDRKADLFLDGVGFSDVLTRASQYFRQSIVLHHNFEPDYYADARRIRRAEFWFVRAGFDLQRCALRYASVNLFLTKEDLERAASVFGPFPRGAAVFGVYEPIAPLLVGPRVDKGSLCVLITGNLSERKGYAGMVEMLGVVRDRRMRLAAKVRFIIAGRNPTAEVRALADGDFIQIIENPPAIEPIARSCDVYLNPNFTGSGIKVRNFDGLRHGLPILCRLENAAGFNGIERPAFQTFSSTDEGLALIDGLDRTEIGSVRMRQRVWKIYAEHFAMARGVDRLRKIVESAEYAGTC